MKTDEQLHSDVIAKLEFVPSLDARRIIVEVKDHIVTLAGSVGSFIEKRIAERAVQDVAGVQGIVDQLKVSLSEINRRSDADIAKAAIQALQWNVLIPPDKIKITVENGRVTLTGDVGWEYQRQSAEKSVRRLYGVADVNNHIQVKPAISKKITVEEVEKELIKEFERNAEIDAKKIQVEVQDSTVILKGNVRSWAEIREAVRAAGFVPGVTKVDNRLTFFD